MMTSTIRKFGVGVASLALVASAVAPAFAAGEAPRPLDGGWDRIASSKVANDRIDTAIEVAKAAYQNKAEAKSVYIVNYMANIDAATAGQLTDGPILLVKDDSRVLAEVKDAINTFTSATTVYAVGGTAVVSDSMLKAVAGNKATGRIAGADRYDTAVQIAERVISLNPDKSKNLYLSRGDLAIDALTAGTLDDGPVLLVKNGALTENTKSYIEAKKPTKIVGLGGKSYVPDSVLNEAQRPAIDENPAAQYDELKKLIKAFQVNRTLYLGNNEYAGTTSVEMTDRNYAGTSADPRNVPDWVAEYEGFNVHANWTEASAASRWQGYEKQLDELQKRMDDIVMPAIKGFKKAAQDQITDAAAGNGNRKIRLQDFASQAASGAVGKAAKAMYGVDLKGTTADADYYILEPDPKAVDENGKALDALSFVTGVNWDKLAENDGYKSVAKAAAKQVKAYRADVKHPLEKLYSPLAADAERSPADQANYLASKRGLTINGDLDYAKLVGAHVAKTDSNPTYLMVVKNSLDGLISIADANATTTKTAMNDALSKLETGKGYIRLWGADRYETAAQISRYRRAEIGGLGKNYVAPGGNLNNVYVANGITMVDALVAGVFTNGPILLADANGNLPKATLEELDGIGKSNVLYSDKVPTVLLIGGKSAVPDLTGTKAAAALKDGYNGKPEQKKDKGTTEDTKKDEPKKDDGKKDEAITTPYTADTVMIKSGSVSSPIQLKVNGGGVVADANIAPSAAFATETMIAPPSEILIDGKEGVVDGLKVEWLSTKRFQVTATSLAPLGTHTVTFKFNGKEGAFKIKVMKQFSTGVSGVTATTPVKMMLDGQTKESVLATVDNWATLKNEGATWDNLKVEVVDGSNSTAADRAKVKFTKIDDEGKIYGYVENGYDVKASPAHTFKVKVSMKASDTIMAPTTNTAQQSAEITVNAPFAAPSYTGSSANEITVAGNGVVAEMTPTYASDDVKPGEGAKYEIVDKTGFLADVSVVIDESTGKVQVLDNAYTGSVEKDSSKFKVKVSKGGFSQTSAEITIKTNRAS